MHDAGPSLGLVYSHILDRTNNDGPSQVGSSRQSLDFIKNRGPVNVNGTKYVKVSFGEQDTKVETRNRFNQCKPRGVRGKITKLSVASRNRMILMFRNLKNLKVMVTLTYPGKAWLVPVDGKAVKRHLKLLQQAILRKYPGLGAAWFLEFQERGAPHFHMFATMPIDKGWLAKTWNRIAGANDPDHLRAGIRVEWLRCPATAAGAYAAKYSAKSEQKEVPEEYQDVGRFWGTFGKLERAFSVVGYFEESRMYGLIRDIRRAYKAKRRGLGLPKLKIKPQASQYGFTAWGVGADIIERLLGHHAAVLEC